MDFSQFKVATEPVKEKRRKKKEARFILTSTDYMTHFKLVRVVDTHKNNEEVLRVETSKAKEHLWIAKAKQEYKPIRHDQ